MAIGRYQLNLIPGFVDPADMRELKRIVDAMGINSVVFPDTSGVLDLPQDGHYRMFPHGGTTIEDLKSAGDSCCTIALGHFTSHPAATELDEKCGVGCAFLELPIGMTETDRFIHALRNYGRRRRAGQHRRGTRAAARCHERHAPVLSQ